MYKIIDFNKFKEKVIDRIEENTNEKGTEYVDITIYFTDGTNLNIGSSWEEGCIDIYD